MSKDILDLKAAKEAEHMGENCVITEEFVSQLTENDGPTPSLVKIEFELPTFENPFKDPNNIPTLHGGIKKVPLPQSRVGASKFLNDQSIPKKVIIEKLVDHNKRECKKIANTVPKRKNLQKRRQRIKQMTLIPATRAIIQNELNVKMSSGVSALLTHPVLTTLIANTANKSPNKSPMIAQISIDKKKVANEPPRQLKETNHKNDNLIQKLLEHPMTRRMGKREPTAAILKVQPECKKIKKDAEKIIMTSSKMLNPAPVGTIPEIALKISQSPPKKVSISSAKLANLIKTKENVVPKSIQDQIVTTVSTEDVEMQTTTVVSESAPSSSKPTVRKKKQDDSDTGSVVNYINIFSL